jgi:hypothetical protein
MKPPAPHTRAFLEVILSVLREIGIEGKVINNSEFA